jgi:hypothetical protein
LWQFALVMHDMKATGVRDSDLRRLITRGVLAHAVEQGSLRNGLRRFRTVKGLSFTSDSCFVLTVEGEQQARRQSNASTRHVESSGSNVRGPLQAASPSWNIDRRLLLLGDLVVKEFRRPAPHQELVLASFEELHWNPRIDDPIPPERGMNAKERLHDAIKKLNQSQLNPLIRFHGDGTGRGVCWELRWRTR